jgi:translation initiation factor IF-2
VNGFDTAARSRDALNRLQAFGWTTFNDQMHNAHYGLGNAAILEIFKVSKVGNVAGCRVTEGTVERGANVRLVRDNVVVHEGKLSQLKRFKDDAREVVAGQECGMAFENYHDMRVSDVIECFRTETVQRTLMARHHR